MITSLLLVFLHFFPEACFSATSCPHPVEEPIEQLIELLKLFDYSVGHRIPIWLHTRPTSARRIKTSYRRP